MEGTIMMLIKTTLEGTMGYYGPRIFGYYVFPTKKVRLIFLFKKKPFLENDLKSPLIFVFILKGKTK